MSKIKALIDGVGELVAAVKPYTKAVAEGCCGVAPEAPNRDGLAADMSGPPLRCPRDGGPRCHPERATRCYPAPGQRYPC